MPRDTVTVTEIPLATATTTPAGVTITPANGIEVLGANDPRTIIRVTNTAGAEKNVTIKAGATAPPAMRRLVGDVVVKVAATTGDVLLSLETARHITTAGAILIDMETGHTGKVSAFKTTREAL